jgi:hypothetical protein
MAWPRICTSLCSYGRALAGGDQELRLHEIDARDELGHRMLDLDAGVHLDEVELPVLIEELERARAAVADRAAGLAQRSPMVRRWRAVMPGSRRLLDDLLVAALHGAVALAQVDDVAEIVREHLELDVARPFQEPLHVDLIISEGGARLGLA